ncbi:MAG: ABC transporter ATP-binding protein [Rhodobacterales bacterium]|nr:ABC transporter ATP-binding protein [Rhodobacterales bacterium]NCT12974.1 ABC transporter ATP-binding protein [Rhodobacterales bacterium]
MTGGATLGERLAGWLGRLVAPFDMAEGPPPQRLVPFMRWALAGTMPVLLAAAFLSVISGGAEVLAAMLLGLVIDALAQAGAGQLWAENRLLFLGAAVFLVALRPIAFGLTAAIQSISIAPNINVLVLSRLHRWTMGQAITFFDNDFAGRIAQKQMQAARALTESVVEIINTLVYALASIIATLFLVIAIDWRIAVVLLVWLVGYLAFIRHYLPVIRERAEARANARALVTGQVVDTVTNIRTVKLFAHHDHEDQAAISAMDGYRNRTMLFGVVSTVFRFYLMIIAGALPVLMVGTALYLWSSGGVTPGDIAATGVVSLRISQMTGWVSFTLMGIYANIGEVEDGIHTLTPPHQLTDRPGAGTLGRADSVVYDDVSFAYGRTSGGVSHINLTIKAGEKIGLVGASGAGKSSLVALLLRLYDTETGAVRVGGQDVRDVTQESLRRQIGMVTQETAMFNRTAMDNIRYGRPDATDEEVFEAARRAQAHDFILTLEDFRGRSGYGAYLGERGVKLSGGQRQRIALARAILKDAPILVLDEATSALDSEVEAAIQTALDVAMQGKTVIAIAHRLSTLSSMDRIVVLDAGQIVEEGTHEGLLAQRGLYARFWNRQSGGFINAQDAAE